MMKRPRSFISTLLIVIFLASVGSTFDATRHVALAGGIPRVLDPRAGDPTEPSDAIGQDGNESTPSDPDPLTVRPDYRHTWLTRLYDTSIRLFTFWQIEGGR